MPAGKRPFESIADLKQRRVRILAEGRRPVLPQHWRPKIRADCEGVSRPCPYFGCRYNIDLDVMRNGSLRWRTEQNRRGIPERDNCALDLAERRGLELEQLASVDNCTSARIRQEMIGALNKLVGPLRKISEERG